MNRTAFLVDGFNLYHSLLEAESDLGGRRVRWLDLRGLLVSYLAAIGSGAQAASIRYFTALAVHRESHSPGVTARHQAYLECLREMAVVPVLGRFKRRSERCPTCGARFARFEEKETDVAISACLLSVLYGQEADSVVLVTGDTDLAPAVRTAVRTFPDARIHFLFPYRRVNRELRRLVPRSFKMSKEQYLGHQLPNPFLTLDGRAIRKPPGW